MKGSISEFELGVIRSRMHDAKHGKALRGDLRISVPIGYIWHREMGLGLDPSLRVQEAAVAHVSSDSSKRIMRVPPAV